MTAIERLNSLIKSLSTIYRLVHCMHAAYNMQKYETELCTKPY